MTSVRDRQPLHLQDGDLLTSSVVISTSRSPLASKERTRVAQNEGRASKEMRRSRERDTALAQGEQNCRHGNDGDLRGTGAAIKPQRVPDIRRRRARAASAHPMVLDLHFAVDSGTAKPESESGGHGQRYWQHPRIFGPLPSRLPEHEDGFIHSGSHCSVLHRRHRRPAHLLRSETENRYN